MLNPPDDSLIITYSPRAHSAEFGSTAEAWLDALPEAAALIASAPLAVEPYGAAVLPASQYIFDQELLGFEAQLRSFTKLLGRFGRTLHLAPLPEIFATPRSLAAAIPRPARHANTPSAATALVHLRLGPVRCARVMKGATNIAVLADDVVRPPVDTSAHPLGTDSHLPAPFQAVLAAGMPRRAGPPGHIGRLAADALPVHKLPDAFTHADLELASPAGWPAAADEAADWQLLSALRVRSLAEFRTEDWMRPAAGCEALHAPDWRRAMALTRRLAPDATAGGFVLLPWNLSNPASIVPDLVGKLLRWDRGDHPAFRLVLYPFNATPTTRGAIAELAASAAQIPGSAAALRGLFVAKLHASRVAAALPRLFPLAWIEADDPESEWTARRLVHLGLCLAVLGKASSLSSIAIAPDETLKITCLDHFGARTYAARTLSARKLGTLLARSHKLIATCVQTAHDVASAPGRRWAN